MHLIPPSVTIIKEKNPFKKIEKIGRTCYKSEKNITEDSAKTFYKNLVQHEHTAMLEHATFIFEIKDPIIYETCTTYKYLNCTKVNLGEDVYRRLVSGNLRAINETGYLPLIVALREIDPDLVYYKIEYIPEMEQLVDGLKQKVKVVNYYDIPFKMREEELAHHYTTMKFICDRGVSHELVRHRPFSFAQESTRYVNYSKERFGGGDINFILPYKYDEWSAETQQAFETALINAEKSYNELTTKYNLTAQQARAVLPNALKTELIVTGNEKEWQHFFNLRSRGITGAPHPDMKWVADMALRLYEKE